MKRVVFAIAVAVFGLAVQAAPAFYAKAHIAGVGIVSHVIPKVYGPGAFETKMAVFNCRDAALRGELKVVFGDKVLAQAPIDLPPNAIAGAVQELTAKGEVPADAKGQEIKVILAAGGTETVCYAGKVGEKTVEAPVETPPLPNMEKQAREFVREGICCLGTTWSYGQRADWRFADRMKTVSGVKAVVKLVNVNRATTNLNLALQVKVADRDGILRTYLERRKSGKIGEEFSLATGADAVGLNGRCHVTAELINWENGWKRVIAETDVTLPERLELVPPWYRDGVVSTCRKTPAIRVGLKVNSRSQYGKERAWKVVAKNADGDEVAAAEGTCAATAAEIAADLPFAKDAPAGTYALEATLADGKCTDQATDSLRIVAPEPGQIIVDQDGYLLNEGKPYLPLGVYHCHSWCDYDTPIDETGLKMTDMGFNWMQIWGWDYDMNLCVTREEVVGTSKGELDKLKTEAEKEALINKKIEAAKYRRELLKKNGTVLCYEGFDIWDNCIRGPGADGKYAFEHLESLGPKVRRMTTDPDHLVRMFYLADEAGGNFYGPLSRGVKLIRAADAGLHPTFSLGNKEAILAGDYGGIDAYCRYYGGLHGVMGMIGTLEARARDLAPYQIRPFAVPQAFGLSPEQSSETPEYVRIQAYLSLIHGASGLGFYCWKQTGDWDGKHRQGMGWNPPTAHEVKRIIAEVKVFSDAIMAPGAKRFDSADGNVHALLCGNAETGRFLVCANAYELPVETTLAIEGVKDLDLEPLFGAPKASCAGGFLGLGTRDELKLEFAGWQTAVWRIK